MTIHLSTDASGHAHIRRRPDGSFDVGYYHAKARRERNAAIRLAGSRLVHRLRSLLGRRKKAGDPGGASAPANTSHINPWLIVANG
jgi:hypothetical protein